MEHPSGTRHEAKLLIYFSLFSLAIRLLLLQQYVTTNPFFPYPISDSRLYLEWAESILEDETYFTEEYQQPPGYPVFLAIILKLSASNLYAILLAQTLLVVAQCILIFYCAKRLFGVRPAWVSFALYSFCGPVIFYSHKLLSETLYTTLILGSFFYLLRIIDTDMNRFSSRKFYADMMLCGLLLGIAIEVRGNAMILILPALIAALRVPSSRRIGALALLIAAVAVPVLPVLARNVAVAGAWTPVASNWGGLFYFGNNEQTTGGVPSVEGIRTNIFDQMDDMKNEASKRAGRRLSSLEAQRFWFNQGITFIRTRPLRWINLEWKKLRRMLQDHLPSGIYSYPLEMSFYHNYLRYTLAYGLMFPLFFFGSLGLKWNPKTPYYFGFLGLQIFVLLLYWPEERYILPILPFLMMGAGCIALVSKDSLRKARRVAAVGVGLLLCLYANVRPIVPGGAAIWYSNVSSAHYAGEDFVRAAFMASESVRLDPKFAEGWTNLGAAFHAQGMTSDARDAWLRAVELNPSNFIAIRNLAISYEHDPQKAAGWWERALLTAREKRLPPETIRAIEDKIQQLQ